MVNEKISGPVPDLPLIIRFRGRYDFDGLLALIRGFYKRARFEFLQEPKFKYKMRATGAEGEFQFTSKREITDYIQVQLDVAAKYWDVKRDDAGLSSGKIEIKIHSEFIVDYANYFSKKKPLDRWMQDTLDAKNTGLQFVDNKVTGEKYLEKLTAKLQDEIKKHLKMECL